MVRKGGNGLVSRVPLPNDEEDCPSQPSGSARWSFGRVMKRKSCELAIEDKDEEDEEELFEGDDDEDGLIATDPEGWLYGDNRWQKWSAKGGLGNGKVNNIPIPTPWA